MPFIEQDNFHKALNGNNFDFPNPWDKPANWPAAAKDKPIKSLICSSDGVGTGLKNAISGGSLKLPCSNYLGFFSGLNDGENVNKTFGTQQGLFRMGIGTKITEIQDGTSNTMAVSEYLTGINDSDSRGYFLPTAQVRSFYTPHFYPIPPARIIFTRFIPISAHLTIVITNLL
jgi:hypothetical protein